MEQYVTLKFDEIQIKPKLEFRSKKLSGFADNDSSAVANHIQAIMIKSIIGDFSDVVRMIPVTSLKYNQLLIYLEETIDFFRKNRIQNYLFNI